MKSPREKPDPQANHCKEEVTDEVRKILGSSYKFKTNDEKKSSTKKEKNSTNTSSGWRGPKEAPSETPQTRGSRKKPTLRTREEREERGEKEEWEEKEEREESESKQKVKHMVNTILVEILEDVNAKCNGEKEEPGEEIRKAPTKIVYNGDVKVTRDISQKLNNNGAVIKDGLIKA
jgi:hypothetical protein